MEIAPDMSQFDRTVAKDHAAYDGCLVKLCENQTIWTRSNFSNMPLDSEHFYEDARRRAIGVLQGDFGVRDAGKGTKSFLPEDLAFGMLWHLGVGLHARRKSLDEVCDEFLAPMRKSMKLKALAITQPNHPLGNHSRVKNIRSEEKDEENQPHINWIKTLQLPDAEMRVIGKMLQMTREEFVELLRRIQPFLVDIDDTHVRSPLSDLRSDMRQFILQQPFMTDAARRSLFEMVRIHWEKHIDLSLLERINNELAIETGDPDILERTKDVILQRVFIDRLSGVDMDAGLRHQMLERKILLESIFLELVTNGERQHMQVFVDAYDLFLKKMRLEPRDLGYLALQYIALLKEADDMKDLVACLC